MKCYIITFQQQHPNMAVKLIKSCKNDVWQAGGCYVITMSTVHDIFCLARIPKKSGGGNHYRQRMK